MDDAKRKYMDASERQALFDQVYLIESKLGEAKEAKEAKVKDKLDHYIKKTDVRLGSQHNPKSEIRTVEEKNNGFKYYIENAEAFLRQDVEEDWKAREQKISEHSEHLHETIGRETAALDLKDICETSQVAFLEELSRLRQEDLVDAKNARIRKLNAITKEPDWVLRIADLVFLLDHFGYSNHTKWRSNFKKECLSIREFLLETFPNCKTSKKLGSILKEASISVNMKSAREFIPVIHDCLKLAEDLDDVWKARVDESRKFTSEWKERTRKKRAKIFEQVQKINAHKDSVFKSFKNTRQSREVNPSMYVFDAMLLEMLRVVEMIPVNQNTLRDVYARYLFILSDCAKRGLWHISIPTYTSMYKRLKSKVSNDTYRLVIASCKRSIPPNSFQAFGTLQEMLRRGFSPDVQIYNILVDACVPLGEWRRAGHILKIMGKKKVKASAVTYDTLRQVASHANSDHSPQVYEVFKLCGVPETIAFACANRCGENRKH